MSDTTTGPVTQETSDRYLVISSDSHAGPSLERSLRPHCPKEHLDQFDAFVKDLRGGTAKLHNTDLLLMQLLGTNAKGWKAKVEAEPEVAAKFARMKEESHLHTDCPGHDDPVARLADMDEDGVAAELIFAGGQNSEVLPFIGFAADAGPVEVSPEMRMVGFQIWNRWLAEFVSTAPERLLGVMQIPIWDVDAAVREIREGHGAGLKAINFPAPRWDFPSYNDAVYEPLWEVCEELRLPLVSHSGGGETPLGFYGKGGPAINGMEMLWLGRRALWQLIFGGVFDRHPGLRFVMTEQRMAWMKHTLTDLDFIHKTRMPELPKRPSEYWDSNCYNSGSYMSRWEADLRHEIGVSNLLWGSDYPHQEGTWPYTRIALRNAFSHVPEPEVRKILGENALDAYHLDGAALRTVADRIGPTPAEIAVPLEPGESPGYGGSFREPGTVDAASF